MYDQATPHALEQAIERAVGLFRRPTVWRSLQRQAMARDFSWDVAARQYLQLYGDATAAVRSAGRRHRHHG
jgi:starch synthase